MATIQGVYVALFGRPADPNGLSFFKGVTNDGADLTAIGDLSASAEYKARFEGMNNVQIVNAIYQSLFGHDADAAGLAFFVNALSTGAQSINTIAINILDGAQGTDKTIVDTKIAAADAYTAALDTGAEIVAYSGTAAAAQGIAFLKGVTTTAPTAAAVDAAVKTMVDASGEGGTGTAGVTITLTAATDAVSPTAADAKFKSTDGNDTIRGLTNLATTSQVDGGKGVDTLSATIADVATTIKPVIANTEMVNLTSAVATLTTGFNFDAGDSKGIDTLKVSGFALGGVSPAITNLEKATTVSLDSLTTAASDVVSITYQSATGTSDSASVAVNKVGATGAGNSVGIKAAGIEMLSVAATGANFVGVDVTDATKLTFTGAGSATVTETGTLAKLATVDASAMTGALTFTASGAHANTLKITTGEAADTVTLTASTGVDNLVYTNAKQSTIAKVDTIAGFDANGEDKIDIKAFALGTDTTIKTTTLTSTGSDVPSMFDTTNHLAFNNTTNTLYIDIDKNGNFDALTDMAVQMTGVTVGGTAATLDITDFILA
jgi:hypothetical protein